MDPQSSPILAFPRPTWTPNLFLCDSSVFPDQTINPRDHVRRNGSMGLSYGRIVLQWNAFFAESLLSLVHTPQEHTMFAIHSRYARMNFACSSTLSHQETNNTSLLFFACLHFQCWTNTLYTTLTSQSNKETAVWTCAFSLCMSPSLQMVVLIRNNSVASFCEELAFYGGLRFSSDCPS